MKKIVTGIILLSFTISFCFSNSTDSHSQKIGLVLSGGGIKGFGHLGTLHLVDSLNIPIDFIVGSSIGAISGALYATGHSPEEIDKIGSKANWDRIFGQSPGRNELYYFQKLDAGKFNITFGLDGFKPTSPISLSNGQYSYEHLLGLFHNYSNISNYDDLLIPFRCNATDIISGEEIIYDKGSIAKALRVSTSIPTIFSPIEDGDRLLADGGLINNLPSNIAENIGADFIIASSVLSSEKSKEEIVDVFNIIERIIDLYGFKNKQTNILKADILINPQYNTISSINTNPKIIEQIKNGGKKAAYQHIDRFLELSQIYPENSYIKLSAIPNNTFQIASINLGEDLENDELINQLFKKNSIMTKDNFVTKILKIRHTGQYHNLSYKFKKIEDNTFIAYINGDKNNPIIINKIIVEGNKKIPSKDIIRMFDIKKGEILNINFFNNEIRQAYNTGYFEYMNYDLIPIDSSHSDLIINVKETRNKKVKFGITWDNHYKLLGKIKLDIFNKPFRKFRLQNELIFSGFKQNELSLYYLTMSNRKINIIPFIKQTNRIKYFGTTLTETNSIEYIKQDLDNFSYGAILAVMGYGSIILNFNQSKNILDAEKYNIDYSQAILDIDQLDNLLHPRNGYTFNVDYQNSDDIENDFHYLNIQAEYFKTFSYNHTIRVFGIYKESSYSIPPNFDLLSTYGGYNWAVGYDEFELSSYDLSLSGIEYQFHYKNSTTFRFIINHIEKFNNLLVDGPEINNPINYGFGIKVRSIFGPINFTWGRGYDNIMDENSKRINLFYFNFGVEI